MAHLKTPRGPQMKATLERHVVAEPSKFHYRAAAKGLRNAGVEIMANEIPRMHHVKELAIWVDTVLWCAGDGSARNALLDRMLAKEARLVVDAEVTSRANLSHNDVPVDDAAAYMAMLEADVKER
jgi:Asp-tRNA(Asn)/Glu-tRNA(Gln) amidotransferase A subunit family amidase